MQKVSAVILDLGGVLLNIDYGRTRAAFAELGIPDFDSYYNQFKGSPLFEDLETGRVKRKAFFDTLREKSGLMLTDEQITEAWNAMLLDFPRERVEFLKDLRSRYKLFLLSNTNEIHYDSFHQHFREVSGLESMDDLFDKAYYSFQMGARKPDTDPFQMILDEQGLDAEQTLFVDDTESNLVGAKILGLQTIHLRPPLKVEELGL
jgi:putative hydrolase of the HAD superfamily